MKSEIVGEFVKSSYSGQNGDCVEVAPTQDGRAVRDSKDLGVGVTFFGDAIWGTFMEAVKTGQFNR
jgi:hypothetical protein